MKKVLLLFSCVLMSCASHQKHQEMQSKLAKEQAVCQSMKENYEQQLHQKNKQIEELQLHIIELNSHIKKLGVQE